MPGRTPAPREGEPADVVPTTGDARATSVAGVAPGSAPPTVPVWPGADGFALIGGHIDGTVLIMGGHPAVRHGLRTALVRSGLAVEECSGDASGLADASSGRYDLVLLLTNVHCPAAVESCRRIRTASDVPLILYASRASGAQRAYALEVGADDYIVGRTPTIEAVTRVRSLLRRRILDRGHEGSMWHVGDLEIDASRRRATLAGRPLLLTRMEFRLLAFLAEHPGRVHTPGEILRHLWATSYVGPTGACKAHICNLRHKIEANPSRPRRLVTVRSQGYALVAPLASDA